MGNGAILGAVLALASAAWFTGYLGIDSVTAVTADPGTVAAEPTIVVDGASLWILALLAGAVGGLVLASVSYGIGRASDPASRAYSLGWLLVVGAALGAVMTYSVVRLGVTTVGDVTLGEVTVAADTLVLVSLLAGALAGALTAPIVDALARPASVGPRNEATPVSSRAFWTDLAGAIGIPVLAIALGAILAVTLAQVLLSLNSTTATVAVFSVVAAAILALTTLLALRPWDKTRT